MAGLRGKIRERAICPLCSDLYEEPKILPCLHTFCKRCLTSGCDQEERKCSICPETYSLSSVEDFPTDTAAVRLVESITKYQMFTKGAPPLCQSCAYKSEAKLARAVASCLHCSIFLCTSCVTVHKRLPLTSVHQVVCLDDVKSGKVGLDSVLNNRQDLCTIHNKPLELFCKKERCFLCLGCAIAQHRNHSYDFIPQIVEEHKDEMEHMLPDITVKVNKLEHAITEIEKRQFLIQKRKRENVMKIEETFEEIIATVLQRKEKLLAHVNEIVEGKIQSLNEQLNKIEILLHQMKQYCELTEKTIQSESNHAVMCMRSPIIDRSKSLAERFFQTELAPSVLFPRKMEFQMFDRLVKMIEQLGRIPTPKSCSVRMDPKVTHERFCQFTLTVKNAVGDPILGYASFVNAVVSFNKDGPTIPLPVYEAGDGDYMIFNSCRAYCKKCIEPMDDEEARTSTRPCCFCDHCNQYCFMIWNQWVSVQINGKHVPGSPFDCM